LCGPSFALILTGRYAFRTGATSQDATGRMEPSVETMMPVYLKPAGYVTASIGKWGQLPLGPAKFGFDEYLNRPDTKKYLPDVMHDFFVDFITRHRADPF
jgi:arylsulfatase A-like enzyme